MASPNVSLGNTVYDDRWEPIGTVAVDIANDASVHYRWECDYGCHSVVDEQQRWMAYADCYHHHYTVHAFHDRPGFQWGTEQWITASGFPVIRGEHV